MCTKPWFKRSFSRSERTALDYVAYLRACQGKNRKKQKKKFLVAENGPFVTPFSTPKNPPEKLYVGPFLRSFPGNEAHIFSRKRAEYCFESTVSEKRTHWVLRQTRWVLRETRWVRFGTQIIGREERTEFAPRNSVSPKQLTVFGPFPIFREPNMRRLGWGTSLCWKRLCWRPG